MILRRRKLLADSDWSRDDGWASEDRATVVVRAPAKLNLTLQVQGKRPDGYHALETLLVPLTLHDTVSITPIRASSHSPAPLTLQVRTVGRVDGELPEQHRVPTGVENLAHRAVERLRDESGTTDGAHIRLVKRIPSRAGLGGGSSDAASALIAANKAWGLNWDRPSLAKIAAELGSDVPFFLAGRSAVCRGRGEHVSSIRHATRLDIVLATPPNRLSTADVFGASDFQASHSQENSVTMVSNNPSARAVAALRAGRIAHLGQALFNDLQRIARDLADSVDTMAQAFARLDVVGHAMTGSGSAYFGICRNALHARRVAATLRSRIHFPVLYTSTCL